MRRTAPMPRRRPPGDHLARAYFRTFGLPVIVTNCSNNYGPHQMPEKLIPLIILNALEGKPLPIYGDGQQIRDCFTWRTTSAGWSRRCIRACRARPTPSEAAAN